MTPAPGTTQVIEDGRLLTLRDTAWASQVLRQSPEVGVLVFSGPHGHQPSPQGYDGFAPWALTPFKDPNTGTRYLTAEHFMMAEKARMFGDSRQEAAILKAPTAREARALGRAVRRFDPEKWTALRGNVAYMANTMKFWQHPQLRATLVATDQKILVAAIPSDPIWGNGLSADDPEAANPEAWTGLNLLGFCLMQVRDLAAHEQAASRGST